jgi:hypothetical protein
MGTDGHRSSEAWPSCIRFGVVETIWRGILSVASMAFLSVFICVHLWLKALPAAFPEKPSISVAKICENPSKTHYRQPSSSLNFFLATRPPPPGLPTTLPAMGNNLGAFGLREASWAAAGSGVLRRFCAGDGF